LANTKKKNWAGTASWPMEFPLPGLILPLLELIFIIYIAFTHKLSHRLGSWLAGPTTIYFLSTVSILWGQGVLEISKWILIDFIILYLVIYFIFWLIKKRLGVLGEVEAIAKGEEPL